MTDREVMQMALDALEAALSDDKPYISRSAEAIEALRTALAQPVQPMSWVALNKEADEIVRGKVLWKRHIDGTPLSNDIACWMADFAEEKLKGRTDD